MTKKKPSNKKPGKKQPAKEFVLTYNPSCEYDAYLVRYPVNKRGTVFLFPTGTRLQDVLTFLDNLMQCHVKAEPIDAAGIQWGPAPIIPPTTLQDAEDFSEL